MSMRSNQAACFFLLGTCLRLRPLRDLRRQAEGDFEDDIDIHGRSIARGGLELPRFTSRSTAVSNAGQIPEQARIRSNLPSLVMTPAI